MSKSSDNVKKWRINTKKRLVEAFGGKCGICGYNKCNMALEFHHLNPNEKEFSFGSIVASPKSWSKIVNEIRKCICVCSNCHKEIHAHYHDNIIDSLPRFNENYATYDKKIIKNKFNKCCCGKLKPTNFKYCSKECASKSRNKINWDNIDLEFMIKSGMSYVKIGKTIGVSDQTVRKRVLKLGLRSQCCVD